MIISAILIKSESKEGKPYMIKNAMAKRVSIKIGEEWYGTQVLGDDVSLTWQAGQDVPIETYEQNGFKNWRHIRGKRSYPATKVGDVVPTGKNGNVELILAKLEEHSKELADIKKMLMRSPNTPIEPDNTHDITPF